MDTKDFWSICKHNMNFFTSEIHTELTVISFLSKQNQFTDVSKTASYHLRANFFFSKTNSEKPRLFCQRVFCTG